MKTKTGRKLVIRKKKQYTKSKGFKKYNTGCILGGTLSFPYPARLKTLLKTVVSAEVAAGTPVDYWFKLNSIFSMGAGINFPLGTFTAFGTAVPTGAYYLISSDSPAAGASIAPYRKSLVKSCSIKFEYCPEGATNKAVEIMVIPRYIPVSDLATLQASDTVAEQRCIKSEVVAPTMTTRVPAVYNKITVKSLVGLSSLDSVNDSYCAVAGADPANCCYWQVRMSNVDGSVSAFAGAYRATIIQEIEFFDQNLQTSGIPA